MSTKHQFYLKLEYQYSHCYLARMEIVGVNVHLNVSINDMCKLMQGHDYNKIFTCDGKNCWGGNLK